MMYEQRVLNLHHGDKERHRVTYCCQRCDLNSSCSSKSNSNCGLSSVLVLAERATAIDQTECVSMWNLMPGAKSRREATGEERRGEELRRSDQNACQSRVHVRPSCGASSATYPAEVCHISFVSHICQKLIMCLFLQTYTYSMVWLWLFGYGLDGLRRGLGHATFLALLIN